MNKAMLAPSNKSPGHWVWVLPAAYAIHVAEEAFGGGGLMGWMAAGGGARLSLAQFAELNLIGIVCLCLATWMARRWGRWRWLLAIGGTIVLANGAAHIAISAATRTYVPGLWSGLSLYVPIGALLLIYLWRRVSRPLYAVAVATGFGIHGAVIWIVLRLPAFRPG
jgi:hypothetical protein